jgi:ligand-binding SRPBCC domain-containing protein
MVNISYPRTLDTTLAEAVSNLVRIDREPDGWWGLRARQRLTGSKRDVFPFFADAANLGRITPAEKHIENLTPPPITIRQGTLIEYRIRTGGIRMRWKTLISEWNPPHEFVDVQLSGPYADWIHRHRFVELATSGTLMEDYVRFRLPLGRLGALAGPLVRRQLRRIFTFRAAVIDTLLQSGLTAAVRDCTS